MLVVKDEKKIKLVFALAYFAFALLLLDFFLSKTMTNGVWEGVFASIVFFLAGPLVMIKLVLKEKARRYFMQFSFDKKGLLLSLMGLGIYVFTICGFVLYFDWKNHLSISSWALGGIDFLIFANLVLAPFVLFSKEFFFRGYLMKTVALLFGFVAALVCQALLSVFLDLYLTGFSLAWQQMTLLFILYLFLGFVAWANKSVVISSLFSWLHVLAVNFFVMYQISKDVL